MSAYSTYKKIKENVSKVIVGKDDVIDLMIISLFASGHILLEDVPGTGKTMLVKSLARSIDCSCKRIQFTPDLLPSDITGINYFNMKSGEFEFVAGPVFSNIVIADEINRATPKTQSGLLECMEERQATIDGKTYSLPVPFMVVATQNPLENMGVFPLPEAQLDRFLIKTDMSYPDHDEALAIIGRFGSSNPLEDLESVVTADEVTAACGELSEVKVDRDVASYIVTIIESTRKAQGVELGASPRAALSLLRVAKGFALINGRNYVKPDDVKKAAKPVLSHRLILTGSAKIKKNAASDIIETLISGITVPTESQLS